MGDPAHSYPMEGRNAFARRWAAQSGGQIVPADNPEDGFRVVVEGQAHVVRRYHGPAGQAWVMVRDDPSALAWFDRLFGEHAVRRAA